MDGAKLGGDTAGQRGATGCLGLEAAGHEAQA